MAWIIQWLVASYSSVDNNYTLTVDHTKVGASLTDFPVYVNLNDVKSGITLTEAQSIRIYNSSMTELARDIVTKDKMTFKADSLSSSVDTVFNIVMDWVSGDYAVTATYGRNNVYTGYKAYYDFASGNSNDRTWNGYNGTDSNMSYSGDYASFNGSNSRIAISPAVANWYSERSITYWLTFDTLSNSWIRWILWPQWENWIHYQYSWTSSSNQILQLYDYTSTVNWSKTMPTISTNNKYFITTNRSATAWKIEHFFWWSSIWSVSWIYWWIQTMSSLDIWRSYNNSRYHKWYIYYIWIASSALSSTRISTEYNNQSSPSTFYTIS